MSKEEELRAHLAVIAEHSRDALALLESGVTIAPGLELPVGSSACGHRRRERQMGGYWTCLDCGAKGREQ